MTHPFARSLRALLLTAAALGAPSGCMLDYLDPFAVEDAGSPDASVDADATTDGDAPCVTGTTVVTSCGEKCGTMLWTCNDAGSFSPDVETECTGEGACTPGDSAECGTSLDGVEYCGSDCSWSSCAE